MREIIVKNQEFNLKDNVLEVLERTVKPFGTSAKLDVPKRYLGKRTYVVILED